MAVITRCPECQARLKLDPAPEPGEPVECPKCGSLFQPPAARNRPPVEADDDEADDDRPAKRKPGRAKPGGGTAVAKKPAGRKSRKKRTNPAFLIAAIGFGFLGLAVVFYFLITVLGRAGRVMEMCQYVPAEANWVRGVNTAQLAKYPGYKAQVDKHLTPAVQQAADEIARAAAIDPAKALDYLMVAKVRSKGSTGTVYVLYAGKKLNGPATGAALGATPTPVGTEAGFRCGPNAPGILADALVHFPTPRVVVVVPPGPSQDALARDTAAGKGKADGGFAAHLKGSDAAKVAVRGAIWLLVRPTDDLATFASAATDRVKSDFPELDAEAKQTKLVGVWTSPGGTGVRVGVGFDAADKKAAEAVVAAMYAGKLGKGDESVVPNSLRNGGGVSFTTNAKIWTEFMQYAKYKSERRCAYLISDVSHPDAVRAVLDLFNAVNMGAGGAR